MQTQTHITNAWERINNIAEAVRQDRTAELSETEINLYLDSQIHSVVEDMVKKEVDVAHYEGAAN